MNEFNIKYHPRERYFKKFSDRSNLRNKGNAPEHMKLPLFQQIWDERYASYSLAPADGQLLPCTSFKGISQLHLVFLNKLIKRYVLTQNYHKLSLLMIALSQTSKKCPELVWKLGTFLLQTKQSAQANIPIFQNLMKLLLHHELIPEFYLDSATRKIKSTNDIGEEYQKLTAVVSSKIFPDYHPYFVDFYGHLEYLLWKQDITIQTKLSNVSVFEQKWNDDDELDVEDHYESTNIAFHSDRAIQFLKRNIDHSGSISVLRYADLINSKEGFKSCRNFLSNYLKQNESNPDAYRIYLLFVSDEEERLKILKEYSLVNPTSTILKELIVHCMENGYYVDALGLLVDRISHRSCSNSLFDWKWLSDLLTKNNSTVNDFLKGIIRVNPCWGKYLKCPNKSMNSRVKQYQQNVTNMIAKLFDNNTTVTIDSEKETILNIESNFQYENVSSPELISKEEFYDANEFKYDYSFFETSKNEVSDNIEDVGDVLNDHDLSMLQDSKHLSFFKNSDSDIVDIDCQEKTKQKERRKKLKRKLSFTSDIQSKIKKEYL